MSNNRLTRPFRRRFIQSSCTPWKVVPSPNNPTASLSYFNKVAAVSPTDVWTVGVFYTSLNYPYTGQTLIEHWDGTSWNIIPSPSPTSNNPVGAGDDLWGIAAVSSTDIWAVGGTSAVPNINSQKTLIEHWDGTTWSIISSPNSPMAANELAGVDVVTATDIWAVGYQADDDVHGPTQPLIEHWDGTTWSITSSPSTAYQNFNALGNLSVITANDIWAVGLANFQGNYVGQILLEHWDGTSWKIVPSPNHFLSDIAVISPNELWAVGAILKNGMSHTLIEHWDGTDWEVFPSPSPGWSDNALWAVTSISADNIWAVGNYSNGSSIQPLVVHWNGSSWDHIPCESAGPGDSLLYAVAKVPGTHSVWAVGLGMDWNSLTVFSC